MPRNEASVEDRMEDRDDRPRCVRRHRRRTLDGSPRRVTGESLAETHRRERSGRPRPPETVGPFLLVHSGPAGLAWQAEGCRVELGLARNRWHTIFATRTGAPQVEEHETWGRALAYARGYMEQYGRPGVRDVAPSEPLYDATLLDEVEVAIGEVQAAIDDIPDIDAVSRAILEE